MENFTTFSLEDRLPNYEFDVYDPSSDSVKTKKIYDYQDKRLILFFYPADFTFVCPTELKDLMKVYKELKDSNADILVVSTDTVFSHKRRIETEKLLEKFEIPMASDRKWDLSKMLQIYNKTTGNAERGTFILSPESVIKAIEMVTEPIGRSSIELLRKVRALEFVRSHPGHACPASRNTGEQTLQPSIKIAGHVAEELK